MLPDGQPCRWQEWSMVSRDIIDIREFREINEISEISEISDISEDVIGLGFVVGLEAYLTEGEDVAIGEYISGLQYSLYLIEVMNCEV